MVLNRKSRSNVFINNFLPSRICVSKSSFNHSNWTLLWIPTKHTFVQPTKLGFVADRTIEQQERRNYHQHHFLHNLPTPVTSCPLHLTLSRLLGVVCSVSTGGEEGGGGSSVCVFLDREGKKTLCHELLAPGRVLTMLHRPPPPPTRLPIPRQNSITFDIGSQTLFREQCLFMVYEWFMVHLVQNGWGKG